MESLFESINIIFNQIQTKDILDIILVWIVVYRVLILTKNSGAVQILSGIGILAIAYLGSIWLELITFNWLLEKFFSNLFLITVILFQAEIRRALAQIGSNPFFNETVNVQEAHVIEEVAKGVTSMAQKGHGALVVIEREIGLDYFVEMGTEVDAAVRAETLSSIFLPSSPLHDGACIVRNGRIYAAGCFLPLSKNPVVDKNLGTRHRAAIGLTEETDAFVLVVSEENHSISVVQGGQLTPDLSHSDVLKHLCQVFGLKMKETKVGAS